MEINTVRVPNPDSVLISTNIEIPKHGLIAFGDPSRVE